MNSCALFDWTYYFLVCLIWLWGLKRSSVRGQVRAGVAWPGLKRGQRGASLPVNPCFFVEGHHVIGPGRAFGGAGVVPHRPQSLVSSSPSTTPRISSNRTIPGTRPGFTEFPSFPKNEKCRRRRCSRSTSPTFPFFPHQSVETVPLCTLR